MISWIKKQKQKLGSGFGQNANLPDTPENSSASFVLSVRVLANVELGDSAFSLDTLMTVCKILSCSSDELLFGNTVNQSAWSDTTSKISQLDVAYKESIDKTLQGILELITKAKQGPNRS